MFDVRIANSPAGTNVTNTVDIDKALNALRGLPFDEALPEQDQNYLWVPDRSSRFLSRVEVESEELIFGAISRTDLKNIPLTESSGDLERLELAEGKGLSYETHFLFDYPRCRLMLEFNPLGPKQKDLARYILSKLDNHPECAVNQCIFTPRFDADRIQAFLNEHGPIGRVDFRIERSSLEILRAAETTFSQASNPILLSEAIAGAARLEEATVQIGISLARKPKAKTGGLTRIKPLLAHLARTIPDAINTLSGKVESRPDGKGNLVEFNLISENTSELIDVEPRADNPRYADTVDMRAKMTAAYRLIARRTDGDGTHQVELE